MAYDRNGSKNPRWKGGRRKRADGYILVYQPGHPYAYRNFVLEHRLIMGRKLGRHLQPHEIVHHINGVRDDNRIENLLLTSHKKHPGYHGGEPRKPRWKARATRDEILNLYWKRGLTKLQCAERLGLSYGSLHHHFVQYEIPTRKADPWWVRKEKHKTLPEFVIIADTREKKPYVFPGKTINKALQSGDYSLLGLEERVAVERKQSQELFLCVGRDRDRFKREIIRLSKFDYAALVIEGDLKGLLKPSPFSRVSPKAVINSIVSWSVRYGLYVFFASDRAHANALVYRILEKYWKHKKPREDQVER